MQNLSIKNHLQETRLFQNRCLLMLCITALIIVSVLARLIYLQVFQHGFYFGLSRQNVLDVRPVAPTRGLIYDRNGVLLANNIPTFTLTIIPEQAKPLDKTLTKLKSMVDLNDDELERFNQALKQYHRFDPVPLKYKLSEKQVDQIYLSHYRLPGVNIRAELMRNYPLGEITSDVVGYVGRINARELLDLNAENYSATPVIGKTGIEKQFEAQLHGHVGNETVETDASGREIRQIKTADAKPGQNLTLTIDSHLQKIALDALGNLSGAIVAVDPNNGQVLALVSTPTFDPNQFVVGLSHKQYQQLIQQPDHPLINRAVHGVFAAASTAKPFYVLEGYSSGLLSPKETIYDPGWFRINGTKHIYHDWHDGGHGWVNATKAIAVSCDTFFYHLALKLGLHRLDDILNQFGFGQKTGIALPSESKGLLPTPEWKMASQGRPWYTGDTVVAGIGQGYVLVTPLQLAMATAALSVKGQRYKPQLLLKTQDDPKQPATTKDSTPLLPVSNINTWMWNSVIHAMNDVITKPYGTGLHFGRHAKYSVAAKTGTAQVYGHTRDEYRVRTTIPKRLRNDSLFIAFAPIDKPKIALTVVVEHDASAPQIARKVLDAYFTQNNQQNKQA